MVIFNLEHYYPGVGGWSEAEIRLRLSSAKLADWNWHLTMYDEMTVSQAQTGTHKA